MRIVGQLTLLQQSKLYFCGWWHRGHVNAKTLLKGSVNEFY